MTGAEDDHLGAYSEQDMEDPRFFARASAALRVEVQLVALLVAKYRGLRALLSLEEGTPADAVAHDMAVVISLAEAGLRGSAGDPGQLASVLAVAVKLLAESDFRYTEEGHR